MKTLEMMNKCKGNNLKFVTKDMFYNEKLGFHNSTLELWPSCAFININDILKLEWEEKIEEFSFEEAYKGCYENEKSYEIPGENGPIATMVNSWGDVIIETNTKSLCITDLWIEKVGE